MELFCWFVDFSGGACFGISGFAEFLVLLFLFEGCCSFGDLDFDWRLLITQKFLYLYYSVAVGFGFGLRVVLGGVFGGCLFGVCT